MRKRRKKRGPINRIEELSGLKDRRVMVYRNLQFRDSVMWSGRSLKLGHVMFHLPQVALQNCVFKVSEKGRQRVLEEKQKNVHAGIVGVMTEADLKDPAEWTKICYDPYKYSNFVRCDNLEPVYKAQTVVINQDGVWCKF